MTETPRHWIQAARTFDGGSFRISYEWKEMLTYWEGDKGFVFECGWGVDPGTVVVPNDEYWDKVVPPWLVGRRAEVVDRLTKHSGHIVKEEGVSIFPAAEWRLRVLDQGLRQPKT